MAKRRRKPPYQHDASAGQPTNRIPADLSQQAPNNSYGPPQFYEDIEFTCVDCDRKEVWTAADQKWWFEVAKGSIYAGAKRCRECRVRRRESHRGTPRRSLAERREADSELRREFVEPFSSLLLHANFLRAKGNVRREFVERMRVAVAHISRPQIRKLIHRRVWDESLAGGWFAGLLRAEELATLLLQNLHKPKASQGACVALGRLRQDLAVPGLRRYLTRALPAWDLELDVEWAIGALAWLDRRHRTSNADEFVNRGELWNIVLHQQTIGHYNPQAGIAQFAEVMDFCREHFDAC
jgi:hypothetical protein